MARVQAQLFDWQEFVNPPPHKIFVWDKHGTYQDCLFPNPVHGHFLGGKKLKGKRIFDVLGQRDAKILLGVIHNVLACRQPRQAEISLPTQSGTYRVKILMLPAGNLAMGLVTDHPLQAARLPGMGQPKRKMKKRTRCSWEETLTRREQQLVEEVRVGMTNRQIAQKLHITPRTVKFHLANIFTKLHISTREALKPTIEGSAPMNGKAQDPSVVIAKLYR